MAAEEKPTPVERYIAPGNAFDIDGMMADFHPGVVWDNIMSVEFGGGVEEMGRTVVRDGFQFLKGRSLQKKGAVDGGNRILGNH